ncbi:hypothetical protein Tco_1400945 [Tanacetum coccineum]
MDNPDITMEEYIQLKTKEALRRGWVFNWETATYGKISYPDSSILYIEYLWRWGYFKTLYGVLIYPDMAPLPPRNLRHAWLRFEGQVYTDADIQDFEERLGRIFDRRIFRVQVLDFDVLTEEMDQALADRLRMEHTGADGQVVFTSYAWRQLFRIRGPLVRELILEFFNTCRFRDSVLDLDAAGILQFQLGGLRRRMSWRQFILALDLHIEEELYTNGFRAYWAESSREITSKADLSDYWTRISSASDFLSIAPEKVTFNDLFFLRSVDEGTSVNVPYLLAYYIFRHASGRKQGARMSGGHFIARLGVHFKVITEESLWTLTVEVCRLTTIDIDKLVRLRIYEWLGDEVTWVAMGRERQHVRGAVGAAQIDLDRPKGATEHQEGVQADLTPAKPEQIPSASAPAPRTILQRMQRLEEEVQGLRDSIMEQRVVMERLSSNFISFSTWMITRMTYLMDQSGLGYLRFDGSIDGTAHVPYQRRTQ